MGGQTSGWSHFSTATAGLTAGYCSYSLFCPELDLAAVVLTNSTTGTPLCAAVTDRLIKNCCRRTRPRNHLLSIRHPDTSRVSGRYTGSFGVITVEGDQELMLSTDRHPTADGEWQPEPESRPRAAMMYSNEHAVVLSPRAFRRHAGRLRTINRR